MESCNVVLTFESVDEILCFQMKPLQKLFYMVLSIEYVVLVKLKSVDEILWRYHLNETSSAVLSHGTIY